MRKTILALSVVGMTGAISGQAAASDLKEFWASPPTTQQFTSSKSAAALEMCIGLEISGWWGPPFVLRGERETLVTMANARNVMISVKIADSNDRREIILASLDGWKNRAAEAVGRCL